MDLLKWIQMFVGVGVGGRTAVEDLLAAGEANPDTAEIAKKAREELTAALSDEQVAATIGQLPDQLKNVIALRLDPRDSPSADI